MRRDFSAADVMTADRFLYPARVVRVCLLLIVAQVALLGHIDEIDETESVEECELCLLLNACDDFIEARSASEPILAASPQQLDHSIEFPSLSLPVPQARGPPQA